MSRPLSMLVPAMLLIACGAPAQQPTGATPAPSSPQPGSTAGVVRADTVATGFEHPWGVDFLPDGRMLVTERPGRLRIVSPDGTISQPVAGVPAVFARGQGGLLDVAVDPEFASNRTIYLTFAEPGSEEGTASTAAARAQLGPGGLENVQVIYRQAPKTRGGGHYGSRIVFRGDGTIFITAGDRMNQRPLVQDLSTGIGKVVRINRDGSVPADNPFVGREGARPEIWSLGHRNAQAATLDPAGNLWTVEHGARGGDELNQPRAGKNYGWPVITYGVDYSGVKIGEGTHKEGMEQPVYWWDPVIAPSGMTFYTGDKFPAWRGSILIGSMTPGALVRLEMAGGRVVREERYLGELGARFRDVIQGPDGYIYVVTDAPDGSLLRIVPAR